MPDGKPAGKPNGKPTAGLSAATLAAVGAGAALGAVSRFLLGAGIDSGLGTSSSALSTTAINLLGCLVFGIVSALPFESPRLKAACGTGFCGGFTTFSAFVILLLAAAAFSGDAAIAGLSGGGARLPASLLVAVALVHIVGCPLAYWLGTKCPRGEQ